MLYIQSSGSAASNPCFVRSTQKAAVGAAWEKLRPREPVSPKKKGPGEIMGCFWSGPSVLVARALALVAPIVLTNRQNKARPVPPSQAEEEETLQCTTNCYKWAAIRFQLSYAIVLKNALTSFV